MPGPGFFIYNFTMVQVNRPHIGIFGKMNAGKSSLINALTGQQVSVVAQHPGTTTDPVKKIIEILERGLEVRPQGVRPKTRMVGHSGYMVFARKL